ncbi:MAG: HTTM domain-containing protein, partial [bacterium]
MHPFAGGGHDRLFTNALFLLLLSPAGATLSLDARRRTGSFVDPSPRPAWTRTLLVFQLCVVYLVTGVQKLGSEWFPWGGASAVYYALLTPSWAR